MSQTSTLSALTPNIPPASFRQYLAIMRTYPKKAWTTLLAAIAVVFFSSTVYQSAVAFTVGPVSAGFDWPLSHAVAAFTLPIIIAPALLLPLGGYLVGRSGLRTAGAIFGVLYGLSTAAVAVLPGNFTVILIALTLSVGCSFILVFSVAFRAVAGWMPVHSGAAFAIVGSLTSLVSVLLPPILAETAATIGWRALFVSIGLCYIIVALPMQLFFLTTPTNDTRGTAVGITTNQDASEINQERAPRKSMWGLLRRPVLLASILINAMLLAPTVVVFNIAESLLSESGYTIGQISLSLSAAKVGSVIGLIFIGPMLDRAASPRVIAVLFVNVVIGLAIVATTQNVFWALLVAMFLIGMPFGAELIVPPLLMLRYFGKGLFAQALALNMGLSAVIAGAAPTLAQILREQFGSGTLLITLIAMTLAIAALTYAMPKFPILPEGADMPEEQAGNRYRSK
ncbi:MFS transporter [Agrobacterium vitis]|uniref:MFS transporter n=1 Tax=Agrobacterium vitis TaxID=373 RepID=A0AAE4X042_AGRVI|nr:MFS transporter [Agrobacterium vitis]MBF2714130.1 MFS transporter [Agrobacterium vitis]MUO81509.1 MFS transporter [Agrobacterium vitis]MUO95844.1 MFS transporter [Agrobacterium vitis]MVA93923.1 MFS transporter [Agrobacterium vitis]MVB03570.1 MFS transporter [Agrobacterium vitis]